MVLRGSCRNSTGRQQCSSFVNYAVMQAPCIVRHTRSLLLGTHHCYIMSLSKQPVTIFVVMASVAFGLLLGCLVSDPDPRTASTKLRAALHHDGLPQDQGVSSYIIFRQPSWQRTVWGRACYSAELTTAQQGLCQLPSVWRNCTQGFYLDIVSEQPKFDSCSPHPKAYILSLD